MTNWTCRFYVQQSKLTKLHIKCCYLKISKIGKDHYFANIYKYAYTYM